MSELDKFTSTVAIMAAIIYANEPSTIEGAVQTSVNLYEAVLKIRNDVNKMIASMEGRLT